jgi:hypothetical protein
MFSHGAGSRGSLAAALGRDRETVAGMVSAVSAVSPRLPSPLAGNLASLGRGLAATVVRVQAGPGRGWWETCSFARTMQPSRDRCQATGPTLSLQLF